MLTTATLSPDHLRALTLIAFSRYGISELLLVARGFQVEMLTELVHGGFARAEDRQKQVGGRAIVVRRLHITEAGHRARAQRL